MQLQKTISDAERIVKSRSFKEEVTPVQFEAVMKMLGVTKSDFAEMLGHTHAMGVYWSSKGMRGEKAELLRLVVQLELGEKAWEQIMAIECVDDISCNGHETGIESLA